MSAKLRLVVDNPPKKVLPEEQLARLCQLYADQWAWWFRYWQGRK